MLNAPTYLSGWWLVVTATTCINVRLQRDVGCKKHISMGSWYLQHATIA